MTQSKQVFIIEDDEPLRNSLVGFLSPLGFHCKVFESAESFLSWVAASTDSTENPACVLTDLRLGGISGYELFNELKQTYSNLVWQTIFITGHAEVSMAVELMQQGAFDFVTKPFDPFHLSRKLTDCIALSEKRAEDLRFLRTHAHKLATLTPQETNVMSLLLSDLTNKEIAEMMTLSTRTVEIHRANMLKKMHVGSAIELSQLNERYQLLGAYSRKRS